MSKTTEGFPPFAFLNVSHILLITLTSIVDKNRIVSQMLRQFAPQFAERSRTNGQYAQQDAQEAWGAIVQAAKSAMGGNSSDSGKFVEKWMTGRIQKKSVHFAKA